MIDKIWKYKLRRAIVVPFGLRAYYSIHSIDIPIITAKRTTMRTLTREFDFNLVYRILDILPFSSLFSIDGEGIPYRLKLFNIFEPQNTTYTSVKFNEPRHATLIEYRHLLSYLDCEELQKAPLDRRYDPVVNAIVSLVLSWTSRDREDFAKREPKYADFMHDVEDFVQYENGDYVYCMEFETRKIAYCKCAFKLIKSVFASKVASDEVDFSKEPFQISRFINPEFVNHLHTLYAQLMTETLTSSDIKKLEQETEIPYNLRSYVGDYEALKRTATVKFITGQACAGKTTLLNSLRDQGHWLIMSRGQIGSFSGKADNPCAVAALHASTEFVLRHSNVLGVKLSFFWYVGCVFAFDAYEYMFFRIAAASTIHYGSV